MKTLSHSNARFSIPWLSLATAVTLATSVIAVVIVRAITVGVETVPAAFTPLSKPSEVIILTIVGVLAASGACLILNRFTDRPVATFLRVAPIALLLSFVPDIAIWAAGGFHHSADAATVIPLMVMHVIVAGLCLTILPRLGSTQSTVVAAAAATT